ncbi:MAG: ketoacyl-ACP synthase III [Propionibacteriaceae bacterium]|jgi:3-oxoacyl-[acyl-carrier-protein] synthase-3|nr:ketoacyl-ACP synthase III [Propionibacteriaceae bacterium]
MSAGIVDVSAVLPDQRITNDYFAGIGLTDEWIRRRTGIEARRWFAPDLSLTIPAGQACQQLVDRHPELTVGAVLVVTTSDRQLVPPLAPTVVTRAGLPESVMAFDMNAACSGFIYSLATAVALCDSGQIDSVIVCCAEAMSRLNDPTNRHSGVIFGDGVAAVLVTADDSFAPATFEAGCSGERANMIYELEPAGIYMDGAEVYNHAVRRMTQMGHEMAEQDPAPTVFIPHQANGRILKTVGANLAATGIPMIKQIAEVGNTSSATIPLALALAAAAGELPAASGRLGLVAYGAGESWGGATVGYRLPEACLTPSS